jgi:hypothetical protein
MIRLTPRATQQLEEVRLQRHLAREQSLRLIPDGAGSLKMVVDTIADDDIVLPTLETPLVIVKRSIAGYLGHVVLDYEDDADSLAAQSFVIRREPRANGHAFPPHR